MYAKLTTHAITEAFNALPSPLPLERNIRGQAIRELRRTVRQGEVRIQLADKNGGVVAVSRAWYANEAMRQLNDSSAYQHVDASRAKSHIAELMGKLKALSQKLSANDRDFIFKSANSEQMPYFYLLLKMHKQPIVGRPIVSWFGYKLAPASAWLDSLLQPLLRLESSVIASSGQFSAALEAAPNHYRECWLVTADIASLYTRMPIKEVLAALSWFLHRHRELGNFQHERIQLVLDIAKLVLDATFFSFEGQMFKQIAGVAMGTPIGPSIANVTLLWKLDVPFLRLFSSDVSFYARFIDDLFAQARDRHTAIRIRSWLSALAPWLDFSVTLHNAAVPFLDMTVFKPPGFEVHGKLATALFFKPASRHMFLPFHSAHPRHVFSGLVVGELIRATQRNTRFTDFAAQCKRLFAWLLLRGYPEWFLVKWFGRVSWANRTQYGQQQQRQQPLVFSVPYTPSTSKLNWQRLLTAEWGLIPIAPSPPTIAWTVERKLGALYSA
jgi:hypothetical protein